MIILPNAGAISTSAEFLYKNILCDHCLQESGLCILKILTIREMVNFQKLDFLLFFAIFNYKFCHYRSERIERDLPDIASYP